MKNNSIILPALLGVILIGGPTLAHAEDSVKVSASASTEVGTKENHALGAEGETKTSLQQKLNILNNAGKVRGEADTRASVNEKHDGSMGDEHASSTKSKGDKHDEANGPKDLASMIAKATENISARINVMTIELGRIGNMQRLSSDQKAAITAELNAQIVSLTALKATVAAETDPAKLKTEMESITKSFRIYATVMPKAAITAAADRVMTIVARMEVFGSKLSTRVGASGSTVAAAALTDFNANVAGAKIDAQAAATLVAGLKPDNGVTATASANAQAIKDARAKIESARTKLQSARKDMGTILKEIKVKGDVKAEASAGN